MMQNVRAARQDADVLLALVDASERPKENLELLQLTPGQSASPATCVVSNELLTHSKQQARGAHHKLRIS